MKMCTKCKETKSTNDFYRRGKGWQAICKLCSKKRHADRYANMSETEKSALKEKLARDRARIAAFMIEVKDAPCTDCGEKYPHYVMHFDHLPGYVKDFNLSKASSRLYSMERILAEIAKCELVCANCHAMRTHQRKEASC